MSFSLDTLRAHDAAGALHAAAECPLSHVTLHTSHFTRCTQAHPLPTTPSQSSKHSPLPTPIPYGGFTLLLTTFKSPPSPPPLLLNISLKFLLFVSTAALSQPAAPRPHPLLVHPPAPLFQRSSISRHSSHSRPLRLACACSNRNSF
jgi:hypothetical protein